MIRAAAKILFAAAAVNVIVLALLEHYDVRLGPIHLVATYLFKPLLYLNASFLVALALEPARNSVPVPAPPESHPRLGLRFWLPALLIVASVYGSSFVINLDFPDWTHRSFTSSHGVLSFFTDRQWDGFYRPLTFTTLWLDNVIFGGALWGYHIQNILIHLLNGALVARLAWRLCLGLSAGRWSGLLFLALPAAFEAVIWPGARFDLLATMFTLIALDQALAGAVWLSAGAYVLGVLSKESAYCYPLLLAALYLLAGPLKLRIENARVPRALLAASLATVLLIGVRIAVYGNLGGYPDVHPGKVVQFVITTKTFTSIPTRLPAALYLVNSTAGLPAWLRIDLLVYVGTLAAALATGVGLGSRAAFLVLSVLAVLPMLNMFGWIHHAAQQGRYLYQPAIWIILAVAWALHSVRRGPVLRVALVASMAAAALFNTLAYVRMVRTVDVAVHDAVAACNSAPCCRAVNLHDLPGDLYGAFYFGDQCLRDIQKALPGAAVSWRENLTPPGPCTVEMRWTAANALAQDPAF